MANAMDQQPSTGCWQLGQRRLERQPSQGQRQRKGQRHGAAFWQKMAVPLRQVQGAQQGHCSDDAPASSRMHLLPDAQSCGDGHPALLTPQTPRGGEEGDGGEGPGDTCSYTYLQPPEQKGAQRRQKEKASGGESRGREGPSSGPQAAWRRQEAGYAASSRTQNSLRPTTPWRWKTPASRAR